MSGEDPRLKQHPMLPKHSPFQSNHSSGIEIFSLAQARERASCVVSSCIF
ncbi:hypothetical protein M3J09_001070 [Ascochyta lentis]